jgi:hypothetical protein
VIRRPLSASRATPSGEPLFFGANRPDVFRRPRGPEAVHEPRGIEMHGNSGILQDIDGYLKLHPNNPTSEKMRKARAQVAKAIANRPGKSGQEQQ